MKNIILSIIMIFCFSVVIIYPVKSSCMEKVIKNSLGMEFVLVPAGRFMMGSPSDEPHRDSSEKLHQVIITKPFYLQSTEVTLKQWRSLMGKRLFGRRWGSGNLPVTRVSWYDCIKFIKKLNRLNEGFYRLPTEAEWEYACRAGTRTPFSWGEEIDCTRARYGGTETCKEYLESRGIDPDGPAPVKSYAPNKWGLYDMHGNVWEWCQDWYGPYPDGTVVDPRGPDKGNMKVRRGGSWFKWGYSCRSANRAYAHPASRFHTTGFRILLEVR